MIIRHFYTPKYAADVCREKTFLAAVAGDVFIVRRKYMASLKLLRVQLITTELLLCYICNGSREHKSWLFADVEWLLRQFVYARRSIILKFLYL